MLLLIFSKDNFFLPFWLKDNYVVPVWTFDINIFITIYCFLCCNKVSIKERLEFWCNSANVWFKYGIIFGEKFIKNGLPSISSTHVWKKVLFAITLKKDLQARTFSKIYSFLCRKSFHFFLLLFHLIGFLILKGSLDSLTLITERKVKK